MTTATTTHEFIPLSITRPDVCGAKIPTAFGVATHYYCGLPASADVHMPNPVVKVTPGNVEVSDYQDTTTTAAQYLDHLKSCIKCCGPLCAEGVRLWEANGRRPADIRQEGIGASATTEATAGEATPRPFKLNAEWKDDCSGKKDYDAPIIEISTRYWPAGGGFYILDRSKGINFEPSEKHLATQTKTTAKILST